MGGYNLSLKKKYSSVVLSYVLRLFSQIYFNNDCKIQLLKNLYSRMLSKTSICIPDLLKFYKDLLINSPFVVFYPIKVNN